MQSPQYEILTDDSDGQASAGGEPPQAAASAQRGGVGAPPSEVIESPARRAHRSHLREDRNADDEDAARARPPGARGAAAELSPIRCLTRSGGVEQLIDRRAALEHVHFPPAERVVDELNAFRSPAHRRLIFEEFFLFQLGIVLRRRRADAERKPRPVVVTDGTREAVRRVLPFKLTSDQKTAIRDIVTDMQRPQPMNRLLQGDVGSGKTIVALMAALVAMENGLQVAFMAPTEILAEQHSSTSAACSSRRASGSRC